MESFDLGIDPPPTDPPRLAPLTPKLTQPIEIETAKEQEKAPPGLMKQKPIIPPKPPYLSRKGGASQGVNSDISEMESDDYHHISEHLQQAAEKIKKSKLSITLQDQDKPSSCLSESDEETPPDQGTVPYDDGEVVLKKVMSPTNWDSTSGSGSGTEGEYLTPKELDPKAGDMNPSPLNKMGSRRPEFILGVERDAIEKEVTRWPGAGNKSDKRYYSYDDARVIDNAIIYHPQTREFVQVEGLHVRVVAKMPITITHFVKFKELPCYSCYDPIRETPPRMNWHGIASKQLLPYMKTLYMKPHRRTPGEHRQNLNKKCPS